MSWSYGTEGRRSALDIVGRALVLVALALALSLAFMGSADASTYPLDPISGVAWVNECAPADASCLALTERLEAVAWLVQAGTDATTGFAAQNQGDLEALGTLVTAAGGGGGGALTETQSDALNLTWWGVWALVGLMFILIAAPRWFAAFRVTHGA